MSLMTNPTYRAYLQRWPDMKRAYDSVPKEDRCKGYDLIFFYVMRLVLLTWLDPYGDESRHNFHPEEIDHLYEHDKI